MDAETIIGAVLGVTKKWAAQRKKEERHASAATRRRSVFSSCRVTIRAAAGKVMRDAYLKASSNGTLPALARQIMYAARGPIQEATGKTLDDQYFCQTLLPDYLREHPQETANWDVVFDARGHFTEPHTDLIVPLGTLDVRNYLRQIGGHRVLDLKVSLNDGFYPTYGPVGRFGAVLFIEKEGFMPLFKRVRLAERYDLAIMSTKGLSVTASRALVDALCNKDVPLLVLHDFDKSGFSIVGTLRRDTRRYEFKNDIRVIDLGLRLADVEANDLESEKVHYGKSDPTPNLEENGATQEEIDFLCDEGDWRQGYAGQRVEMNAFTSGNLVAWLEAKLQEHGIGKVVPDADTLRQAFLRAAEAVHIRKLVEREQKTIRKEVKSMDIPDDLEERVREALAKRQDASWDQAVRALVLMAMK